MSSGRWLGLVSIMGLLGWVDGFIDVLLID